MEKTVKPDPLVPWPRVTVTVLNYNRANDTVECVRSLEKCTYPALDVIIVDNGSTDGSFACLESAFSHHSVRSTGSNLGYTGGIDASIRYAREGEPEYVLLLNNDTVVEPDFLEHMIRAMELAPDVAAACGTIFAEHDRGLVWYAGGTMIPWRGLAVHDRKGERMSRESLGPARRVSFVTGCCMLLRTSLLDEIGVEDTRFFMYLDDIEYCSRITNKGYGLLYVPRAVIYHKVLGEKESAFKLYYSVRNRFLLIHSGFRGLTRVSAMVYFAVVIGVKLLYWSFRRPLFCRAGMMGLCDFFAGRLGAGRGIQEFHGR